MTIELLKDVLLFCVAFNYAVLLVWFSVFVFAHDWLYNLHARWFRLSVESFDSINYAGVALYKIGNILFFAVPLIALYFV